MIQFSKLGIGLRLVSLLDKLPVTELVHEMYSCSLSLCYASIEINHLRIFTAGLIKTRQIKGCSFRPRHLTT